MANCLLKARTYTVSTCPSSTPRVSPRESLSVFENDDIYGSMTQDNQYLELQQLQEPQRLRSTSSGRNGDEDSNTDSEPHYYNFLVARPHSAPNI